MFCLLRASFAYRTQNLGYYSPQYLCTHKYTHFPTKEKMQISIFFVIFCFSAANASEFNSTTKSLSFKDNSFLENVIDFVGLARKVQAESGDGSTSVTETIAPFVNKTAHSVLGNSVPVTEIDTKVEQTDFRVETGVFFDLDKGPKEDDCEEEPKGKLKKLFFFLSTNSTNSTELEIELSAVSVAGAATKTGDPNSEPKVPNLEPSLAQPGSPPPESPSESPLESTATLPAASYPPYGPVNGFLERFVVKTSNDTQIWPDAPCHNSTNTSLQLPHVHESQGLISCPHAVGVVLASTIFLVW